MKKVSLAVMKKDRKGKVAEVRGGNALQHRMLSMGIYPGREIIKVGHFVMRGPIAIKVGRSVIAIGHGVAQKIILEVE